MARRVDKEKAIKLRKKGYSYSQIKEVLGVSKSSLSEWLSDYPLSEKRIKELRDRNPRRIENFRNTMKEKREKVLTDAYEKAKKDIGKLNKREVFIAGLFLYWGEGSKTARTLVSVSNTDPSVLRFFIDWLSILGVKKEKINVKLHLYKDMDEEKEKNFWARELGVPLKNFSRSYIKDSKMSGLTYKNGFGHGTCAVRVYNSDLERYIMRCLQYIRDINSKKKMRV
ncbi:MAG: hypothetical protein ACLFNR_03225 [Candidatus Paceibacterota bacterium]